MSEEKKASIKAEVFSWVKVIVSAIIIALLVDFFIIANAVVPTGSMETTIPAGSRIMGLRLYYDFKEPERGDIVIFKYPDDESVDYLKRIIGLPGETVEIISGKVYINGELLDEPYLKEGALGECDIEMPYQVPEGRIFVCGDNRGTSLDSRSRAVGCVSEEQIVGKIVFRIWPLTEVGAVE